MPRIEGTETRPGEFSPVVTIQLKYKNALGIRVSALVDSGADMSMGPAALLPPNVTWEDLMPTPSGATGAGGAFETRILEECEMSWRDHVFADRLIIAAPGTDAPVLLGRKDFFRTFEVQFQWHKEPPVFHVKPR